MRADWAQRAVELTCANGSVGEARAVEKALRGRLRKAEANAVVASKLAVFRERWPEIHRRSLANPVRPPRPIRPRDMTREERFVADLVRDHLRFVPYAEFWEVTQKTFRRLVKALLERTKTTTFYFVAEGGKSSEWMSLLFLWWCEQTFPEAAAVLVRRSRFVGRSIPLPSSPARRTLVVVDDVAYSGAQIEQMVLAAAPCIADVVVCVPWMSRYARRKMGGVHMHVTLVTTSVIDNVSDILGVRRGSRELVRRYGLYEFRLHGTWIEAGTILDAVSHSRLFTLTIFEHKHADALSLPRAISSVASRHNFRDRSFRRHTDVPEATVRKIPTSLESDVYVSHFPGRAGRWSVPRDSRPLIDYSPGAKIYAPLARFG